MGTYHTFFVATDDELDRLFPGWKRVQPEQGRAERLNPFTKQMMTVNDWLPIEPPTPLGKPSLYDDVWGSPVPPIVDVENDYMAGIEEAGAPGLRALPHFRAKNWDPFRVLDPLATALMGAAAPTPPARIGPDQDDDVPLVWALPDAAAKALATIDDAQLPPVMDRVFADEASFSEDAGDEARGYFVDRALRPMKLLALEALRRGGRVCHYYALHY
jgi:hypothetical protein